MYGANTKALDLRGGASMIIAGLKGLGTTVVDQAEVIERGYKNIDKKFSLLGADVKRID